MSKAAIPFNELHVRFAKNDDGSINLRKCSKFRSMAPWVKHDRSKLVKLPANTPTLEAVIRCAH